MASEIVDVSSQGKFCVGEYYYRCYPLHADTEVRGIVQTWIFQGVAKSECGSVNCDRPNHFYRFAMHSGGVRGAIEENWAAILIPSLKQAEESFYNWNELPAAFEETRTCVIDQDC